MNRRCCLLLPLLLLAIGCGHTNRLARYKLSGGTVYFRTLVASSAASSSVAIENPTDHWAGDLAAIFGSVVLSDQAREKLERAIHGDSIALALGEGVRLAAIDYFGVRPVASPDENPDYIVETELVEYRLMSGSAGLSASVCGTTRIVHRATGAIVWENSEAQVLPLSVTDPVTGAREADAAQGATNAVLLFNLEEGELRKVITGAAASVGRDIGDTLREDLAELNARE